MFRERGEPGRQARGYIALFLGQMCASAALVWVLTGLVDRPVLIKPVVDGVLFFVSYGIQRGFVFRHAPPKRREPI